MTLLRLLMKGCCKTPFIFYAGNLLLHNKVRTAFYFFYLHVNKLLYICYINNIKIRRIYMNKNLIKLVIVIFILILIIYYSIVFISNQDTIDNNMNNQILTVYQSILISEA